MKTKKWASISMTALLCAVLMVSGCSSQSKGSGNTSEEGKDKVTIGFSQVTMESPFYTSLVEAAKAEAEKNGVELITIDAQNNLQKQNQDVQDLITKGIDVLVLNPTNPTAVAPALALAKQNNIPVVTVDRPTEEAVASFVGRDNKQMGRLAGAKAVELLGGLGAAKGKIIELQGDAGGKVMMDRHDGFHEVVEAEKGVQIIEGPYSNYVRAEAVKAMQDLLQAHPDVSLVYAHNDDMAMGAVQVLKQANMLDKVKVVGIDGLSEAVNAIIEGSYSATVLNDPAVLGRLVVRTALKVAKGEQVESYIDGGTGLIDASNAAKYKSDNVFAPME
ncbi:substrate-binding domain-containing protein [Paenibacillus sp. SYP-B4298]|uniref:substrate-binding domain-containing protein n=1 Tax=Paenibacillus sp. SYP-B4298 TaxID=2996034 RepID=UPI0022DE67A1|nr:substrate-binding domain-containing protein [Paenibacillus sp. SYP-B4298]